MTNDHIILQKHLTYFKKTFYIVCNLKNKSEPSPPKPQSKYTLKHIKINYIPLLEKKSIIFLVN